MACGYLPVHLLDQGVVRGVAAGGYELGPLLPQSFELCLGTLALSLWQQCLCLALAALDRSARLHAVVGCIQALAGADRHLVGLGLGEVVKVLVLGGGKRILRLGCLLHAGLLLALTLVQLLLQDRQLHLELVHLLLLSVLLLLLAELSLDLLELSRLPRQGAFLLLVNLPLERQHLLLEVHVLLAVFLFLFVGSGHFGLQVNDCNILLRQLVSQDVEGTLLDLKFVGVELLIDGLELVLQILDVGRRPLLVMLQQILLILELLFDTYYFLLLVCQLPANFGDLVLQLLLKLDDPLFSPLQVKRLLSQSTVQLVHGLHAIVEGGLPLLFFLLPRKSDFLDLFDLSLLEVRLELRFLCPLPHFQLPDGLVFLLAVSQHSFRNRRRRKSAAKGSLARCLLRPLLSRSLQALGWFRAHF